MWGGVGRCGEGMSYIHVDDNVKEVDDNLKENDNDNVKEWGGAMR